MASKVKQKTLQNSTIEEQANAEHAFEWQYAGVVGVDSGAVLICDPSYVGPHINPKRMHEVMLTLSEHNTETQLKFTNDKIGYGKGADGAGYITRTWLGDNIYPVYVLKDENGRAVELRIDFAEPWERMMEQEKAGVPATEDGLEFVCLCQDCHNKQHVRGRAKSPQSSHN
ncbi:MAG: hypothetical protein ACXV7G_13890 [Halobacteriota archaeon]